VTISNLRRLPHTNRYTLTSDGIRIAVFYTKVYNRLLVPSPPRTTPRRPPNSAPHYRPSPATYTTTPTAHAFPAHRMKLDTNVHKPATKDR
jgi:hypothetical protein